MYNMSDYRAALAERDSYDMGTEAWKLAQKKVEGIISVMMAARDRKMAAEIVDEVYSLNDCGMELDDEAIQYDLWLLESNGFETEAEELRDLDWN